MLEDVRFDESTPEIRPLFISPHLLLYHLRTRDLSLLQDQIGELLLQVVVLLGMLSKHVGLEFAPGRVTAGATGVLAEVAP